MDAHCWRESPLSRTRLVGGARGTYHIQESATSSGIDVTPATMRDGILQKECQDCCGPPDSIVASALPKSCADTIRDIRLYCASHADREVDCPMCAGTGRGHWRVCDCCRGAKVIRVPFYCRHPDRCLGGSCKEEIACNE